MKIITTILFVFIVFSGFTQDFDIYSKKQDDKVIMPSVQEMLTVDEFQLLSRNARMMDMFYSAVVPGLIHFKAKDRITGYSLVGLRVVSYAGLGLTWYKLKSEGYSIFDRNTDDNTVLLGKWSVKTYQNVAIASMALLVSTYFYDWIHGKYRLEKKQELIRYRYGLKLQIQNSPYSPKYSQLVPSFTINYSF
jgi:hypothetical protein